MDDESERIRVHLIEGWRTVIVDAQVKFGQVINSITERLSTQYAADHNATPVDNKYGWIFGIRYVPPGMDGDRHEQLWIHPEMMHGEFKLKYNVNRGPDENSDQGRLELRVRYFPARLHEIDRDYRIIFTLLHKQVFAQYMKLDHVKPELAVQLTVLELRRKFPDMSPKAANLIWNENDQDISYRNFFPQAVLERNKVKDLRRDVKREYTRIEADGMEASQAAVMFLQLIKRHLFEFDRECFHVKIGLGWSVKVPVAIGPDDQISHLDAAGAHRRMTDFGQINELTISYPECTLALHVQSKQEPLVLTCESQQELDNLADLIDGYCRGTRTPKQGSILKQYRRELPTLPYEQSTSQGMNGTYTEPQQQFEDDDYAEIGEEMASKDLKFEPGWEIERTLIDIMGMPIGRGQFGNVYKAAYRHNEQLRHVAVKSSHNQDANIDSDRFIEEARIMSKFTHDHIIRLVGVCTERKPIFIVMELCELGSMREYLQQHESLFENDSLQLIKFVKQLASALAYLEQQNFVHRDVAARNLLMADTKTIKLGDFGLSRLLDDQSSYYVASQGKMPIKWMAPESINFRRFTTASDVWMFGVCSWEILSCGTKPFQRVKNNDVIGKIENGERLGRPELCPHQLYSVLEQCWKYDPEERPLSQALDVKVQELIVDLQHNESSLASFTPPPPPEPTNKPQLTRRNPTIPPKQQSATLAPKREKLISLVKKRDPPKEPLLLEDEAEQKQKSLEREEKRKSSIFDSLDRDKERQMSDQKWLEQNNVKPKAANTASSSSNGSSLDRSMAAAPPKPPRGSRSGSTSTSSLSSQSETSQMIIAVQDAEKENVENVQKLIRKDEPPKIIYTSVKVEKTAQLDRDNDRVYQANLKVLIQIKELQTQCKAHGTPDQLLKLVASIGQACRQLCEAVDEFSRDGPETISRQLELEKRSVTSELKQVAQQMQMVKKFAETRASGDYRKGLINASVVLAITSKHLLDTVDKSRLVA